MNKNELFKNIEIDERKFVLGKFDARTGSYILFKLVGILKPLFNSLKDMENADDIDFTELASSLFSLPEAEFKYIQDNCLMITSEILPGATAQVLDKFGTWGSENIEFDTKLVLELTVKSLVFNLSNFFDAKMLSSLSNSLSSFQQNSKI